MRVRYLGCPGSTRQPANISFLGKVVQREDRWAATSAPSNYAGSSEWQSLGSTVGLLLAPGTALPAILTTVRQMQLDVDVIRSEDLNRDTFLTGILTPDDGLPAMRACPGPFTSQGRDLPPELDQDASRASHSGPTGTLARFRRS